MIELNHAKNVKWGIDSHISHILFQICQLGFEEWKILVWRTISGKTKTHNFKRILQNSQNSMKLIFFFFQASSSAQLHEVRRLWHNGKRPLSMDFSDLDPCFSPTGSNAQGYFHRHHHHHHPVTHQHIHHLTKPICSVGHDLHVSDVWWESE